LNQPFDGRENAGTFTFDHLRDMAAQIGLDGPSFAQCLQGEKHKERLQQDAAEAQLYGVGQVPTLIVNGKVYPTARNADDLRQIFQQLAPALKLG
jgi:predicted DsbA family dithiol-disulfide isomerase